jgi:hypothetical protein
MLRRLRLSTPLKGGGTTTDGVHRLRDPVKRVSGGRVSSPPQKCFVHLVVQYISSASSSSAIGGARRATDLETSTTVPVHRSFQGAFGKWDSRPDVLLFAVGSPAQPLLDRYGYSSRGPFLLLLWCVGPGVALTNSQTLDIAATSAIRADQCGCVYVPTGLSLLLNRDKLPRPYRA